MAKTIAEAFDIFHGWLTPTGGETEAAKSHRASIKACLEANFGLEQFYRAGSFGNGTSVRGFSDLDFFAVLPDNVVPSNSKTLLDQVWDVLDTRFPSTVVGIRPPAIVIPFGEDGSESTDVVPARYAGYDDNYNSIYEIADGNGGWMRTGPDSHKSYVTETNDSLSKRLKPLIRFVKAWKFYNKVPIYSFYLEMFVTKYALSESTIVYSVDLLHVFRRLHANQLSMMQDPLGISGYIRPCYSDVQKQESLSKLNTALTRVENAWDAHASEDEKKSFEWWDKLFGYAFPTYY